MNTVTRKLSAVAFLDIEGYSSIVQQNENRGIEIIQNFKDTLSKYTEPYNGEIVNFYGDGVLMTFESVIEATQFAVVIQKQFLHDKYHTPVRVGLHLGDVVELGDTIFGDGVNIASRFESLASAGSIIVSEEIRRQLTGHPEYDFKYLGEFQFKNIDTPRKAYALDVDGIFVPEVISHHAKVSLKESPGPLLKFAKRHYKRFVPVAVILLAVIAWIIISQGSVSDFDLPEGIKANIAVLPFEEEGEASDYHANIINFNQEINISFQKLKDIFSISMPSIQEAYDENYSIKDYAKILSASHLISGKCSKTEKGISIFVELIDAHSQRAIWAKRMSSNLTGLSDLHFNIVKEIGEKFGSEYVNQLFLTPRTRGPIDLETIGLVAEARELLSKRGKENIILALNKLDQAEQLDSNNVSIYSLRSMIYAIASSTDTKIASDSVIQSNLELNAKKALDMDKTQSEAYTALGEFYNHKKNRFDDAEKYFLKALEYNPNDAPALQMLSELYLRMGKIQGKGEAWDLITTARKIIPTSLSIEWLEAQLLLARGYPEEFREKNISILERNPKFGYARNYRWQYYTSISNPQAAIDSIVYKKGGLGYMWCEALSLLCQDTLTLSRIEDAMNSHGMINMLGLVHKDKWDDALDEVDRLIREEKFMYNYFQTSPFPIFNKLKSKREVADILREYNVEVNHIPKY